MTGPSTTMQTGNAHAPVPSARQAGWRRWGGLAAWAAMGLGSLAVFMLYLRPDFLVMMADAVWACF